ncbi:MAG: 1-hydroxy-2-methyl-2-butenyl 4-diphosphate reductase [Chloroflexi bacterium]|nr:1-hydroxy-2-methyl-2-butenyl 4-diphosphate reductase [Chloroflexota bacterium]
MDSRPVPEGLLVLTPLAIEAWAMRRALPGVTVLKTGLGRGKSIAARPMVDRIDPEVLVIAGFCGALDPSLRPGDVVVASRVWGTDGSCLKLEPDLLESVLRRGGIRARSGLIISSGRLVRGEQRTLLHQAGGMAVDMESAWLARTARSRPVAVVRVVVDTPGRELLSPIKTIVGGVKGLRTLTRVGPALRNWASHQRDRGGA